VTVRRLNADKKDTLKYYNHTVFSEENYKKQLEKTSLLDGIRHNNHPSPQTDEASSGSIVPKKRKVYKSRGNEFNQIAWHGSPYTFDAFDISKIGLGEGHQAHGWGLYFAKEEEVAKGYKSYIRNLVNKPAKISVNGEVYAWRDSRSFYRVRDGETFYQTSDEYWFLSSFVYHGYSTKEYMEKEYERYMALTKDDSVSDIRRDNAVGEAARYKRFLNFAENAEIKLYNAKGEEYRDNSTLFKVDIPENDVLLDEQKGYNEQPRKVKTAIRNAIKKFDLWFLEPPTGGEFYEALSEALGDDREASIYLNKKGIKGITYVGKQDGRCFVIFDDKAVKILETYEQQIKDQIAGSYNVVENLIKVFEKGNASTAVHESAYEIFYDIGKIGAGGSLCDFQIL
jgi:hypothetical protein